jgi:hypothetical protein
LLHVCQIFNFEVGETHRCATFLPLPQDIDILLSSTSDDVSFLEDPVHERMPFLDTRLFSHCCVAHGNRSRKDSPT